MKTESKQEALRRLFLENGLLDEDYHKHQHYTIITRSGIEKIQAKNNVTVHYEPIVMGRDFCVIKGIFTKDGLAPLETFGSASKETSQNKYYPEMAEKRCLSRGVLKICKFYELGVFGEDESDDFKKSSKPEPNPEPRERLPTPEGVTHPAKDEPTITEPATVSNGVKYATANQKEEIVKLLNHEMIERAEKVKSLLNINKLDEERAAKFITALKSKIAEREAQRAAV